MVVLPYIGFNWRELYESPYYSLGQAGIVLLVLIAIELLFTQLVKKTGKCEQLLSVLFIGFTILFFYGNNFEVPVSEFISSTLHLFIREKIVFLCIAVLTLSILHFIFRKNKNWKVLNVFLGIYCVVNIFSTRNLQRELIRPIESIQNGYKDISRSFSPNEKGNEKPIILIIMDEYSSPDELYKIIKDSAVYDFSNTLKKAGWEVRNSSYTYEKSTIHSISSLFNFNLSKDSSYGIQKNENIISKKMMKAALIDSLSSKGVSYSNYGIFHIGSNEPLTQLYIYPTNFTEHFLIKTAFAKEKILSNNFKFKNLIKINSNVIGHNNYILNELSAQLEANKNKKSFVYAHLFMPHTPFDLGAEFPIKHSINFENYFLFWKFNNTKVEGLLNSINKVGDYRIILTGDHGFRKNEHNENFHYTFTAFKGFDSLALKQIESIQDIGLLVNAGFK
jgi:hypothetical protein